VRVGIWVEADTLWVGARRDMGWCERPSGSLPSLLSCYEKPHFHLANDAQRTEYPRRNQLINHMNDRDQRRYDRLTRIQTFGIANAADYAASTKAKAHFTAITGHITALDDAKAGQLPARASKETLIDALRLDLKNIARTARSIELKENGFAAPYTIPNNPAESAITTHADAVLKLLEDNNAPVAQGGDTPEQKTAKAALRARFVEYLLPADFVEDLRADRDAISSTNTHNQTETQSGVEDTARIGQILGQATDDVQELDAMFSNLYTRDPAKLHAWQRASRVERAPEREKKPTVPVIPPTA
jgi:hypothetical protein